MTEGDLLTLLKYDLQRIGVPLGDDAHLVAMLKAAKANLTRQGIREEAGADDYDYLVVGTAAWMYRKRISGEAEPAYVKRMRHDMLMSQKMRGGTNAP